MQDEDPRATLKRIGERWHELMKAQRKLEDGDCADLEERVDDRARYRMELNMFRSCMSSIFGTGRPSP